ncbi:MAG: RtcB family protein [Fimbriimonadaceae bacterium]|nr:RtcB family protein [Fimbriimonadaceae bacterium]
MFDDAKLRRLGFADDDLRATAAVAAQALGQLGLSLKKVKTALRDVQQRPAKFQGHPQLGPLAAALLAAAPAVVEPEQGPRPLCDEPVPGAVWGAELIQPEALAQFETARRLPVAVRAAQMPDGHVGYGLPIGGVLATRGAVIPYAVGVDIACRMRLSVLPEQPELLDRQRDLLRRALRQETRFGVGVQFEGRDLRQHEVLDDPAWDRLPLLTHLKRAAAGQLGTSGSGNHFVEFGELATAGLPELGVAAGRYLALLSHSGSRGLGARIADHFTKVAMQRCPLPPQAKHLAWLALESDAGQEYWLAMTLAGRYAAANHELIHRHVLRAAGLEPLAVVENHHNFAWLEEYDGETLVVHRKGATPAGAGVLGVIPGSMGDSGFVVRGKGHAAALCSAAHGAGRLMSRGEARRALTVSQRNAWLAEHQVELLDAGIDESPQVYKPIREVMAAQQELVEAVAEFRPRLVLMAAGGPAED